MKLKNILTKNSHSNSHVLHASVSLACVGSRRIGQSRWRHFGSRQHSESKRDAGRQGQQRGCHYPKTFLHPPVLEL